jgi:inosine-uridine nucleoside N-ribohydrolase
MKQPFTVPQSHHVRVILDTDAACEADDPFAIVQALLSQKLDVQGITAEHFSVPGSMEDSFNVIHKITSLMGSDVPLFKGREQALDEEYIAQQNPDLSQASQFIIREARRNSDEPLFVLGLGASTNIAEALHASPEIASKMTVIWIGTQLGGVNEKPIREFNAANDVIATNILLESGADVWVIPSQVYRNDFNHSENAGWTPGESWSLGDPPAVGLTIDPNCGTYEYQPAPLVMPDSTSQYDPARPQVRIYNSINSRFILEDLFAKLALFSQPEN